MATPMKNPTPSRSHISENSDPNLIKKPIKSTPTKPSPSPSSKKLMSPQPSSNKILSPPPSSKKLPSSPPILRRISSPPPPRRPLERKFIVAKKMTRRGEKDVDVEKYRKAAYEALRASQEEFFRKGEVTVKDQDGLDEQKLRRSIPEPGSGRVKDLVSAFENMLSITEDGNQGGVVGVNEDGESLDRRFSSESFVSWGYVKDSDRVCSSMEGLGDRLSLGSRNSKRNSTDNSMCSWNKKLKVTCQQPFNLRTEQRGRLKEEEFCKKVQEMMMEEEKKRIPVAQGLPWTTDEPEVLVKPPVKERTEPVDLLLHSDVRAVERAEFDNYITERMSFAEQLKMERERQQKLEEEDKLRRLRRELVPKALPMPQFDRPFVPKRSSRPRTTPKEPRFHIRSKKPSTCG